MKLAVSVILGTAQVLGSTALGGTSSVYSYCTWTAGHRVAHQPQRRGNKQMMEKRKEKKETTRGEKMARIQSRVACAGRRRVPRRRAARSDLRYLIWASGVSNPLSWRIGRFLREPSGGHGAYGRRSSVCLVLVDLEIGAPCFHSMAAVQGSVSIARQEKTEAS